MDLPYIFLLFTVIACFATRKRSIPVALCALSLIAALFYGTMDSFGLFSVSILYAVTYYYFKSNKGAVKFLLGMGTVLIIICFATHSVPGFRNRLILDSVALSPISLPFSMYLNFDKTIAGIILFLNGNLYGKEKPLDIKSVSTTLVLIALCSLFLIIPGLSSGYIWFDFKIPDIIFIWSVNNLFFVSASEEIIFRGFIQNRIKKILPTLCPTYAHLILSSSIFGLAHFKGGIFYIALASVAGYFYGLAYEKTGRILCPILTHFGLNLVHFIFFTYPAAAKGLV